MAIRSKIVLLTACLMLADHVKCEAINISAVAPVASSIRMTNSDAIWNGTGECHDSTGRTIQHAMHFVPPGVDRCRLCVCENGNPRHCRDILCSPPDCISFQKGSSCCEFICLDDTASHGGSSVPLT